MWPFGWMALLEEISKQFHLCAALMSDAIILEKQSAVVAGQFKTTMRKIEELRRFLRRPEARHNERYEHWMDESVIDGVKKMVGLILERHMDPLTMEKFPLIFERKGNPFLSQNISPDITAALKKKEELKIAIGKGSFKPEDMKKVEEELGNIEELISDTGNNILITEIKESNCMGAIVLLYYYLYWHILLMLFNKSLYPDSIKIGIDWEIEKFLKKLPSETDMLDLRLLSKLSKGSGIVGGRLNIMTEDMYRARLGNGSLINRSSRLIRTYKTILNKLRKEYSENESEKGASDWWIPADVTDFDALCHATSFHSVSTTTRVFNNVMSTFSLQDDIQKWVDMTTRFEIKTDVKKDKDEEEELPVKTSMAVYTYRLIDVLLNHPYCPEDPLKLPKYMNSFIASAVYDYGSATIMMDVSRSLLAIRQLIRFVCKSNPDHQKLEEEILKFVYKFHVGGFHLSDAMEKYADGSDSITTSAKSRTIAKPIGSYRKPVNVKSADELESDLAIDNLCGYYIGSRPIGTENFNHRYLAWLGSEESEEQVTVLEKILALINHKNSKKWPAEAKAAVLQPMQRNSLFVSNISASLMRFLDCLQNSKFFTGSKYNIEVENVTSEQYFKQVFLDSVTDSDRKIISDLFKYDRNVEIDCLSVSKLIELEISELNRYKTEIKQQKFNKFPCLSWPVIYDGGAKDNYKSFKFKEPIVSTVPSVQVSTYNLSLLLKELVAKKA